jgi:hypothetical protein
MDRRINMLFQVIVCIALIILGFSFASMARYLRKKGQTE